MIDWSKGIVSRYYATIVDPVTWRDVSEVDIISGSIKYSDNNERVSADVDCRSFDRDSEYWIRLYLLARQSGESERIPLFTGIVSVPDVTYNGRIEDNKLQCYSALSLASKIYLPLGWYSGMGVDGTKIIKTILTEHIPAPIVIDNSEESVSPILSQNIVAEGGETCLSMVDKILTAINWRLFVDGNGTIHISPYSNEVVAFFDYQDNDIFEMDVTVSNNWYDVPNVYRAVGSGISSVVKDEDPNSRFSIQNRGREIWVNETDVVLSNNEKIGDYALRKLKEAQQIHKTLDYTRRFDPNVKISDYVRINYLAQGISGIFKIKSQSLTLGYGGKVSETAEGI